MLRHKKIFRNEEGAIDLASIMVGILVIGLIGGVIAGTVFAVIPWAQDKAAKQQLESVVVAQSSYKGLSSGVPPAVPNGLPINSYGNTESLAAAGLLAPGDSYCTTASEDGNSYQAFAKSSSGKYWHLTDSTTPSTIDSGSIPNECKSVIDPTQTVEFERTPTSTILTYECETTGSVTLPIVNGVGTSRWSDEATETTYSGTERISRTLTEGKKYVVKFDGTYSALNYQDVPGAECLRSVDYWGEATGVTDANFAFYNAINLVDVPDSIPSTILQTGNMFHFATSFNDPDVSKWDVSNLTRINRMFRHAEIFNQPLNDWNLSNATYASGMFDSAYKFNQPLDKWDMTNVWAINGMFVDCLEFNQPLNSWNTAKVTTAEDIFKGATKFNQPLDKWNTAKVNNMHGAFENATAMKADLSGWKTTALKNGTDFAPSSFPDSHLPKGTTKQAI